MISIDKHPIHRHMGEKTISMWFLIYPKIGVKGKPNVHNIELKYNSLYRLIYTDSAI